MISLIIGPMFSGKTTELIRQIRRYEFAGKKVVVIKYAQDDRYDQEAVVSHDCDTLRVPTLVVDEITNVYVDIPEVIGVDEGQFIKGLPEWAEKQAARGKHVIIAGLDADFRRNPFPNITDLIPKAEKVKKLSAICACGKKASFSKILMQTSGLTKVEHIGGKELYKPVCRSCY